MTAPPEPHTEPAAAREAPAVIHLPNLPPPSPLAAKTKPKRRRSHVERFRTDDAEHAELERRARDAGLSVNAYNRLRVLGDAGPRARRRSPVDATALMRALVAFNRGNNNLNQLARTGNTLVLFADEHEAERLLDEARELRRAVELLQDHFAVPVAAIMDALRRDR
jgi:hypothetical protein